jgi:hypothetical protein
MTNQMDEIMLTKLSALLQDLVRLELSQEEHRAVQVAMLRAQIGSLTAHEQFMDASEFFSLETVQALQEHTEQIMEATKWFARPGPDKQERLLTLSRFINSLLGLDFLTFCYLVHVAHVASLPPGSLRTVQ